MNSVIFEDIARIQAEKKQKRKEMLKLMNENPDKDKFTIQEYLYLQWIGYSVNAIIEALGMPRSKFWEYKAEHLN